MFYIQLIGLLAFCILVLSFYKKDTATILTYQMTSNFAYSVHYFLLGGISGALLSFIGIFRNIAFVREGNKKIISLIIFLMYLIVTITFYENFYSVFPIVANTAYMICMIKGTKKSLLIGGIISSSFWVLYAIFVLSYVCIVTESILIVSNVIQLIKISKKVSSK